VHQVGDQTKVNSVNFLWRSLFTKNRYMSQLDSLCLNIIIMLEYSTA